MSKGKNRPVRIRWDADACTACMSCVVVCSERHIGMSAPSRARIRVIFDALDGDRAAEYCRQCANAPCAQACPENAIQYNCEIRAWLVDDRLCTGCGDCVEGCPFDAIRVDSITGKAIKCDLCKGATRCVEICPANALSVRGVDREDGDD